MSSPVSRSSRSADDDLSLLADGVLDSSLLAPDDGQVLKDVSADTLDTLFRLWAFDAARDPAEVVRIVRDRSGLELSAAWVRGLAKTHFWAERSHTVHQTLKSTSQAVVDAQFTIGSIEAVKCLRAVLVDDGASATAKVKAATSLLAFAGYIPAGAGVTGISIGVHADRGEYAGVSDEDLARMVRGYSDDDEAIAPAIEVDGIEVALSGQVYADRFGTPKLSTS